MCTRRSIRNARMLLPTSRVVYRTKPVAPATGQFPSQPATTIAGQSGSAPTTRPSARNAREYPTPSRLPESSLASIVGALGGFPRPMVKHGIRWQTGEIPGRIGIPYEKAGVRIEKKVWVKMLEHEIFKTRISLTIQSLTYHTPAQAGIQGLI